MQRLPISRLTIGPASGALQRDPNRKSSDKFANTESLQEFKREKSAEMICLEVKDHAIKTKKKIEKKNEKRAILRAIQSLKIL